MQYNNCMINFTEWKPLENLKGVPSLPGIYILKNTCNGKEYVGKSVTLKTRLQDHCRAKADYSVAHQAIRKYGLSNFVYQVAECVGASDIELGDLEKKTILERGTKAPAGYNLTDGGEGACGVVVSAETRSKISAVNKGKPKCAEHKAKIAAANKGKVKSLEHRAKISAAKGGENCTQETRAKIAAASRGRVTSEETKEKMRRAITGRTHSLEARARMSAVQRGKIISKEQLIKMSKPVRFHFCGKIFDFSSSKVFAEYLKVSRATVSMWLAGITTFPAYKYTLENGEVVRVSDTPQFNKGQPSKNYFTYL